VRPPAPRDDAELTPSQVRVGVDVVQVGRVARLLEEQPAIVATLFTAREQAYCEGKRRRVEHLAARFAAKEAVLKAFGTGVGPRMRWTDVEIVNTVSGRPLVRLHGAVAAVARRKAVRGLDVSLSHTDQIAMAQAVAVLGVPGTGGSAAEEDEEGACGST
jgi:holo-[acyl-carrier protein] synthase